MSLCEPVCMSSQSKCNLLIKEPHSAQIGDTIPFLLLSGYCFVINKERALATRLVNRRSPSFLLLTQPSSLLCVRVRVRVDISVDVHMYISLNECIFTWRVRVRVYVCACVRVCALACMCLRLGELCIYVYSLIMLGERAVNLHTCTRVCACMYTCECLSVCVWRVPLMPHPVIRNSCFTNKHIVLTLNKA